jgi:hypothetical protein
VIEAVPGQIKVHFVGWSSIWDEWIEDDSRRLKAWTPNIRAKEEPATASESSRTKESWMCTADMRGFDDGSRHISQRVRIRDRFSPRPITPLQGALQELTGIGCILAKEREARGREKSRRACVEQSEMEGGIGCSDSCAHACSKLVAGPTGCCMA